MTASIIVGLMAPRGVYDLAEKVIHKVTESPHVKGVWVLTPAGRYRDAGILNGPKVAHIDRWEREDAPGRRGCNRETLRKAIYSSLNDYGFSLLMQDVKWIWMGDVDSLPADDYFEVLSGLRYDEPVILTGKTFTVNGEREYDICAMTYDGKYQKVPYSTWQDIQWSNGLYASRHQHVTNREAFDLGVHYLNAQAGDAHYCWALRSAGASLIFQPELSVTLQKLQ